MDNKNTFGGLKNKNNQLVIEVTNVWANRLIGDEQELADCEWIPGHLDNGRSLKEFPDWFLKATTPFKRKVLFYHMELF